MDILNSVSFLRTDDSDLFVTRISYHFQLGASSGPIEGFLVQTNSDFFFSRLLRASAHGAQNKKVQSNPAIKDVKGLTDFICYRWSSIIANTQNKKKRYEGANFYYHRWISVTLGSVIMGCIQLFI